MKPPLEIPWWRANTGAASSGKPAVHMARSKSLGGGHALQGGYVSLSRWL